MPPTILVAGATGNTGVGVVETLSKLIEDSAFAGYRILATTRSTKGAVAQRLAKLSGVDVIEQSWVEITSEWLREQQVVRAFIAPQGDTRQFAEESSFYVAVLQAGVEYVVRVSTTACNIRPDYPAYYPRNHWAIEALLSSPEFSKLQWSSLQPNGFFSAALAGAVELVKKVRAGGGQETLRTILSEDTPTGIVSPDDVGAFAAHLLLESDITTHNRAKYILNGPEDITGADVVKLTEEYIGATVKDVSFKDVSFTDYMIANNPTESKNVIGSVRWAAIHTWEGKASVSTTSKMVYELCPPKTTAARAFKALLEGA